MKNEIVLAVGDWSGDGHGKADNFVFKTNLTSKEIKEAYKKGVEICGVDITNQCQDYEDSTVTKNVWNNLLKYELISKYHLKEVENEPSWSTIKHNTYLNPEEYVNIWLGIAKLGNPDLEFERSGPENTIPIGGYGLYY